jgi:hypothetical protein
LPDSSRGTAPDIKPIILERLASETLGPCQTTNMNLSSKQLLKQSKTLDDESKTSGSAENPEEEEIGLFKCTKITNESTNATNTRVCEANRDDVLS